jgi:hypothetical protein
VAIAKVLVHVEPLAKESEMIRELDHRASDGIDVRLLWNAETKAVLVSVAERDGTSFEFQVPPADALQAFHHPYAYAHALQGNGRIPLAA